jgi:hypothetical protein
MSLIQTVDQEIKQAMLAKNEIRLRGLRAIKAALLLEKKKKGAQVELSEEAETKALQKQIKQRKDAVEIYQQQNRADLATIELEEIAVLEDFLPKQLSPEELATAIKDIIQTLQVTDPKDMGKVIGAANKQLAGKSDGKSIAEMVKKVMSEI